MSADSKSDAPDSSGWSANQYNRDASFVYSAKFTAPVLDLLDAKPGEKIIDFGCGSGEVSLEIEKIVHGKGDTAGFVAGFDASVSMVRTLQLPEARVKG